MQAYKDHPLPRTGHRSFGNYLVAFTLAGIDGFELDGLQRSLAQIHFQDPPRVVEDPKINP